MFAILFYLTLLDDVPTSLSGAPATIESIDVYQNLLIIKEGPNFLLVSGQNNRIALANAKGKIIASYDKKGEGPLDLNIPIYLGRLKNKFLFLSHWNRLLTFDDHLIPTPAGNLDGPMDKTFYIGLNNTSDWFWIYRGFANSDSLVLSVSPKETGKGFEILKSYHLQPKNDPLLFASNRSMIWIHNNQAFKSINASMDDQYEVFILHSIKSDEPDLILTSDVKGFVPMFKTVPALASVNASFTFPDGYLVRFSAKEKATQRLPESYVDVFSKNGGFKKRIKGGEELQPCVNCPYAFEYQDSDNTYHTIDSVAGWLALQTKP